MADKKEFYGMDAPKRPDPLARAVKRATLESRAGRPYSTFLQEPRVSEFAPNASVARQTRDVDAHIDRAREDTAAMRRDWDAEREATPTYSGGGMVKHGSSTRVTCKTKSG